MKLLKNLYFALLYLLPAILFFSYYPLISLGNDNTMNFELSLPLIFLVIFDIIAFINLLRIGIHKKLPGISDRKIFLFALFPLYATLSVFWSANPMRAILTAGVLWLTCFAIFAIIYITPLLDPAKSLWRRLIFSLFLSTALVCLFCWVQCVLDVMNVSRDITLLCPGCTYRTFGFPHPSGFAIEPQFMGNLLLAPTLLVLYLLVVQSHPRKKQTLIGVCLAVLFSSTLFLTLSRGAIYAYIVALLILFIFSIVRHQKWQYIILIPAITFFTTLTAQGIFSAVSPTSDTFISGTTKILHQLSLGIIDLRPKSDTPDSEDDTFDSEVVVTPELPGSTNGSTGDSQFDGYIPASTNTRLDLNQLAFDTWLSSPYYIFFGVGLGGAGVAMHQAFPENGLAVPNAIVQNEGYSLLLELGLAGIVLVVLVLALAFIPGKYLKFLQLKSAETSSQADSFWKLPILPVFLAIIVAYLITLNFFSGLPNVLHIYLLPPLIYLSWKSYCHDDKPVLK